MTELPPVRKFLFDKSFDGVLQAARPAERKPVTLKPEQYDALKKENFDAGTAAGRKEADESQSSRILALLTRLDERLSGFAESMQVIRQEQEQKARQIGLAIARKILPDFIAKAGTQEIETMLQSAVAEMMHEPRLVVRVHESQFDVLNAKIQDISAQKAYAGKIVVLADAAIAAGDCRVEWADGGMERNTAATLNDIEKVVAPADNATPEPKPE